MSQRRLPGRLWLPVIALLALAPARLDASHVAIEAVPGGNTGVDVWRFECNSAETLCAAAQVCDDGSLRETFVVTIAAYFPADMLGRGAIDTGAGCSVATLCGDGPGRLRTLVTVSRTGESDPGYELAVACFADGEGRVSFARKHSLKLVTDQD